MVPGERALSTCGVLTRKCAGCIRTHPWYSGDAHEALGELMVVGIEPVRPGAVPTRLPVEIEYGSGGRIGAQAADRRLLVDLRHKGDRMASEMDVVEDGGPEVGVLLRGALLRSERHGVRQRLEQRGQLRGEGEAPR